MQAMPALHRHSCPPLEYWPSSLAAALLPQAYSRDTPRPLPPISAAPFSACLRLCAPVLVGALVRGAFAASWVRSTLRGARRPPPSPSTAPSSSATHSSRSAWSTALSSFSARMYAPFELQTHAPVRFLPYFLRACAPFLSLTSARWFTVRLVRSH